MMRRDSIDWVKVGVVAAIVLFAVWCIVDTQLCLHRGGQMVDTGTFTTRCYGNPPNQRCTTSPDRKCVEP